MNKRRERPPLSDRGRRRALRTWGFYLLALTAWVTVVRMAAAAERLRNTQDKTYLIAQACGYEDPNYFSYVFKRHFGVTPTRFRAG